MLDNVRKPKNLLIFQHRHNSNYDGSSYMDSYESTFVIIDYSGQSHHVSAAIITETEK